MSGNSCPISDPISSKQITDIDLLKPKCADFCGNSLNDWLKWLAEKQCECDWENIDLSPIQDLLQQEPTEITECVVVEALIEAVSTLKEELDECCDETIYSIPEDDWTPTRELRAYRKGSRITLTGAVQANVSYTADIATLPAAIVPSTNLYFAVAHDFSPSSTYNIFLRILPTGVIKLNITGSAPAYGAARTVYLDGVTFFLN